MSDFQFELKGTPDAEEQKIIRDGIMEFNQSIINDKHTSLNICVKDKGNIVAGAIIYKHKDALYLNALWCAEEYRNKGIGSKLIDMVESEAKRTSISKLFVDTYGFQAQDFYKKHGFRVIGTVPEYLLGHDRIFMRKDI